MTILGIDGNQWYVTQKGSCLGDPRDKFCFGDTPREAFTGERLVAAFNAVADFWEHNAHAIYAEDGYGSHVSEKTKRNALERQLSQAKRIRAGIEPMGFWLWQRVNAELTGECVGFLPLKEYEA